MMSKNDAKACCACIQALSPAMSVHAATRNHTVHFQCSMEAKCAIAELLDQSTTNLALSLPRSHLCPRPNQHKILVQCELLVMQRHSTRATGGCSVVHSQGDGVRCSSHRLLIQNATTYMCRNTPGLECHFASQPVRYTYYSKSAVQAL